MRLAAVALLAATALAGTEPLVGTVIVLNKSEATATFIDRATGKTVATLATRPGPHEVAVSPDGKLAVVANYGVRRAPGGKLTVFDVLARKHVKTIDLEPYRRPHGIAFLPDGKRLAVTAEANRMLLVVDLETGKVTRAVPTEQNISHMVALTPKGDRAFVANIFSHSMTAIDLVKGERLGIVRTGRGAEGIDVSPDGKEVWVTNRDAGTVTVIDAQTLAVLAPKIACPGFPIRAKFTPDGAHLLVSCANAGDVAVFDAKTRTLVRRVSMRREGAEEKGNMFGQRGPSTIGIVIPPDGARAYVANGNYDDVAVIDLTTWKIVARYETGRQPDGLGFSALPQR